MSWHQVIDERNYEMDQVIASILRQDPAKLNVVIAWIEDRLQDPDYSAHSKVELQRWRDFIQTHGLTGVLERLTERSEAANSWRQSSPFGVLMPQEARMRILGRYETLRPRAHTPGGQGSHRGD